MSSEVIEMELPNGATALARVAATGEGGPAKVSAIPKFEFGDVGKAIEGIAESLKTALDKVAPDKVTVELGLEIAAKAGKLTALVVEGEGKGSLTVTLEWAGAGSRG